MNAIASLQHGLRRRIVWQWLCCLRLAAVSLGVAYAADPESQKSGKQAESTPPKSQKEDTSAEALPLDLSQIQSQSISKASVFKSFNGRQVIDGLPFQIDFRARVFGKTAASRGTVNATTRKGIPIGRAFKALYLLHHTLWPDVEGETVALVCLNYADGSEHIIPIRYGVHVRDWYDLLSYEKETMADPDTTICWTHPPLEYKAPIRIYKSKFENPSPEKVVETMDIVSARNLATYCLIAATVADHHADGAAKPVEDRKFDGKMVVRVLDDRTGKPIQGVLVEPSLNVLDEYVVGSPLFTSSAGEGTIPYPTKDTSHFYASVEKKGYQPEQRTLQSPISDKSITFRLKPVAAESP